jgi:short-subunit dehydrogenase
VAENPTQQSNRLNEHEQTPARRYALVTGASRGLGRSFARTLASRGHNLILVARSRDKLEELAQELRTSGSEAVVIPSDLAQAGSGNELANELVARELQIDLLVNNAGFGDRGRFSELSLERQVQSITLQNATVVELTHRLLPAMIERRRGGIIMISSLAGFTPVPFAAIYAASKAFLTTFSLALEAEVARFGVGVVTVCPGRLQVAPEDAANTAPRKKFPGGEQTHAQVVDSALLALARGGGLVVPGKVNKFAAFAERFVPRSKIARVIKKLSPPPRRDRER